MKKDYKLVKYSRQENGSEFYRCIDPQGTLHGDVIDPNQQREPDFNMQDVVGIESPYKSVNVNSKNWMDGSVLINRETGIPVPRVFEQCFAPANACGLAFVTIDHLQYLYSPQFDYVFPSAVDESAPTYDKIATVFKKNPADFIYLPTDCFRDKVLVDRIFDAINEGLKEKALDSDADKLLKSAEELLSLIGERTKIAKVEIKKHDDPTYRREAEAQRQEANANTLAKFNNGLDKIKSDAFEK